MRGLTQTMTQWVVTNTDVGFSFALPVTFKCRWEDIQKIFNGPNNESLISNAIVGLSADVAVGDYIYLGESVETNPTTVSGAFRVRQFTTMRNLSGHITERVAYL